jgi:hypothetical protein
MKFIISSNTWALIPISYIRSFPSTFAANRNPFLSNLPHIQPDVGNDDCDTIMESVLNCILREVTGVEWETKEMKLRAEYSNM